MTTIEVVTEDAEVLQFPDKEPDCHRVSVKGDHAIRLAGYGVVASWNVGDDHSVTIVRGDFRLIVCRPGFVT